MQDTRIVDAVVNGRFADVDKLTAPLAANAADHFQEVQQVMDLLSWHGCRPQLSELQHAAWPSICEAQQIRTSAKNQFAALAADSLIYAYLDGHELLRLETGVADLLPQLQYYFDVNTEWLARYLAYVAGLTQQTWVTDDFHFSRSDESAARNAAANLAALMIEFVTYSRAEENLPYGRSALMREQLPIYFSMRRTGQLAVRQPITDLMQGKRPFPDFGHDEPPHPLCPDRTTLEMYFNNLLHFARPQPYKAAALYALLPVWLRFLAVRDLIDATQHDKIRTSLQPLLADLQSRWSDHPDPTLPADLKHAWKEE